MIKRILAIVALSSLLLCGCGLSQLGPYAHAEEINIDKLSEPKIAKFGFTFKQGVLFLHEDRQLKNYSCVELVRTKKDENWGLWNIPWANWTLDAGLDWDGAGFNGGALMIGRDFGSLKDYLPIDYPILEKFKVSIYPIGVTLKYPFDNLEAQMASGMSYLAIKAEFD